jgi:hypothetical protein
MSSQALAPSANLCSSAVASVGGANIVAAPGAGKRIRILAIWISASDDTSVNTAVMVQVTVGGAPKIPFQVLMLTAPPALPCTAAMQCNLLTDENTAVIATCSTAVGNRNCGVHYRIESGTGVAP